MIILFSAFSVLLAFKVLKYWQAFCGGFSAFFWFCNFSIFSVISVPSVVNVFGCGSAALCPLWLKFLGNLAAGQDGHDGYGVLIANQAVKMTRFLVDEDSNIRFRKRGG
jgi:hypothetical protein